MDFNLKTILLYMQKVNVSISDLSKRIGISRTLLYSYRNGMNLKRDKEIGIINKIKESEVGIGFDAYKEEYVNMIEAGIIDPVKVTRSALQNATSVASTLLTTESVVASIKEDTPAMPAGAPGMGY